MRDYEKHFSKDDKLELSANEEFQFSPGSQGIIEGYAAVWGRVTFAFGPAGGVFLDKGSFSKTIKDRDHTAKPIPVFRGHDPDKLIGKITDIREDDKGLWMRAQLAVRDDQYNDEAKRAFAQARDKMLNEMSVGFNAIKRVYDEESDTLTIKEGRLMEISLVPNGAIPETSIDNTYEALPPEPTEPVTLDAVEPQTEEPLISARTLRELRAEILLIKRKLNGRQKNRGYRA